MNRGDRRERIYRDDQDRQRLLETLTETCQKANWQIHAYLAFLLGQRQKTTSNDLKNIPGDAFEVITLPPIMH